MMMHQPQPQRQPQRNTGAAGLEPDCCSIEYRAEVARCMLAQSDALQSLFFEDLLNSLNSSQHGQLSGAAGYMRCSLPAAEMALVGPAHVVSMTPPLVEEILFAESYVERCGGNPRNLHFWLFDTRTLKLTDVSALLREAGGETRYRDLIKHTAQSLPLPEYSDHFAAMHAVIDEIKSSGKVLVLPFQTRERHYTELQPRIDAGEAALMSRADPFVDKYDAAENLKKADPSLQSVLLNPVRVLAPPPETVDRFQKMARDIIAAAQEIERRAGNAYIKLDGAGVSGLDNLAPSKHPEMYNGSSDERITHLAAHLERRFRAFPLPDAVIEERVERGYDAFGVREYVASGVTTGNGFRPWCFVRSINDANDVFQGVIGCTNPTRIGITSTELDMLTDTMQRVGAAMNLAGYDFGYIAKDLMFDGRSQSMKINDHNDRRGGRSYLERIMVLYPDKVIMDKDFEFAVPPGKVPIDYAMEVAQAAVDCGFFVYGTCTAFYPSSDETGQSIKMKIVSIVPDDVVQSSSSIVPQMAHKVTTAIEERIHAQNYRKHPTGSVSGN